MRAVLVPVAFVALAGLLWADPWPYRSPVPPAEPNPRWVTDPATVRNPTFRPEITIAGYTYRCTECHHLFQSPPETVRQLTQHLDLELKHGINNRCFNCHHRAYRDAFVDDMGAPIAYDQPHLLCAKCHGLVYRDWTKGVHGRTNGYWDPKRGPVDRKKCIECHDPHVPPFPPMHAAPGPNTLRMGDQHLAAEHYDQETRNPLLIHRQTGSSDEPSGAEH